MPNALPVKYCCRARASSASIVEGEDDKALAAFTLAIATQGNIRFQSLRAYSSGEMDEILAKLP